MQPIDQGDRESRFEDVCKFAAALVAVGLIVFAGETAMTHVPTTVPVAAMAPAPQAGAEPAAVPFSEQYPIDPAIAPEPHVEAF